jgi:hypothetical protein
MGWTKPLPSAWPMGIDSALNLGRGCDAPGSHERRTMLCGIAECTVTCDDVERVRSVPQILFAMTRLATLVP